MPAPSQQRQNDALALHRAALSAVDPRNLVNPAKLPAYVGAPIETFRAIRVVAAGKGSLPMAVAVERALSGRAFNGLAVVPHGYAAAWAGERPTRIEVVETGHPVPDEAGDAAAGRLLAMAAACGPDDLLLALITGGASALCPAFAEGIDLAAARETFGLLLRSGAAIGEMNTVRKHLSRFGGGRLAAAASPATVCALIVSDVPGDDLSVVSSGPTVADPTTFADARAVLERYGLLDRVPASVRRRIEEGINDPALETPKPGDPALARCRNHLIGGNRMAVEAAAARAAELGYVAHADPAGLTGEARAAGHRLAEAALALPADGKHCLVWGGETTVTVRGGGRGGRNQEVALAAALALEGARRPVVVLCAGTDGIDGPTDAAGAWVTPGTIAAARARGLSPEAALENNDAYTFFDALGGAAGGGARSEGDGACDARGSTPGDAAGDEAGDVAGIGGHLRTGPTHTNVMDIALALVGPEPPPRPADAVGLEIA